ncbi:uncharacterized protein LOC136005795 isoform X2 [Lathamus discolor]|uniref:uncharacterized protein LOC136005795 isoform X2 n=1 Tax=Lathamus discolor TaxID=678569 RepID=UPI0032B7742B
MLLGCCFKSHAAFICSCKDRADNRGNSQNQESAVREDHGGRSYQQSVTTLEKIQEYGKEHVKACEIELIMEVIHKTGNLQYKNTMEAGVTSRALPHRRRSRNNGKEHVKACEVKVRKHLHVAVWSSGCPLLAAGVRDGTDLSSLCCPGSEVAGHVAASPVCALGMPSTFQVPPLHGFHSFVFIFPSTTFSK